MRIGSVFTDLFWPPIEAGPTKTAAPHRSRRPSLKLVWHILLEKVGRRPAWSSAAREGGARVLVAPASSGFAPRSRQQADAEQRRVSGAITFGGGEGLPTTRAGLPRRLAGVLANLTDASGFDLPVVQTHSEPRPDLLWRDVQLAGAAATPALESAARGAPVTKRSAAVRYRQIASGEQPAGASPTSPAARVWPRRVSLHTAIGSGLAAQVGLMSAVTRVPPRIRIAPAPGRTEGPALLNMPPPELVAHNPAGFAPAAERAAIASGAEYPRGTALSAPAAAFVASPTLDRARTRPALIWPTKTASILESNAAPGVARVIRAVERTAQTGPPMTEGLADLEEKTVRVLADRVYAFIERRLLIEKERKG